MVNNIATRSSTAAGFGTDWNDGASCKNANILPVTWVNFTAENINNEVSLEWKTAILSSTSKCNTSSLFI